MDKLSIDVLDLNEVQRFVQLFSRVDTNSPRFVTLFLKKSVDWIEKQAIENVDRTTGGVPWYEYTDELRNSFQTVVHGNLGTILNNCPYAGFVEYGTGFVGSYSPHVLASSVGWTYGDKGWYFSYKGMRIYTEGQEPHRFLLNALIDYFNNAQRIYQETFIEYLDTL